MEISVLSVYLNEDRVLEKCVSLCFFFFVIHVYYFISINNVPVFQSVQFLEYVICVYRNNIRNENM